MLTIRNATLDDAHTVGAIRAESWRAAYADFVPRAALDALRAEEIVERWQAVPAYAAGTLIAEVDGTAIGFANFGAARDPDFGYGSELYTIYFRPAVIGKGHGRALFLEVTRRLEAQGFSDMILWTFELNRPAQAFYDKLGGTRIDGARKPTPIDGAELYEIAYGFRLPVAV